MNRDIHLLQQTEFQAIVIGGGIHGATIAYELAAEGLKVALLEQNDFAAGTSANSLKILHSGLRYLQHLNFKRIRESVRSRKLFMQMAPHLIKPMPCIMPTYGLGIEGKPVMGIALLLFDMISCDRNQGAPPENRVGRGRLLSKDECLAIAPGVRRAGLTGASLWYDDVIVNTERMVLAYLKAAAQHQAVCANYLQVEKITFSGNAVTGVEAVDRLTSQALTISAPIVINAAGPWLNEIQQRSAQPQTTEDFAKAVNIVIDKALFPGYGVGISGTKEYTDQDAALKRSKRLFFFAPWQGKTMIGTTYAYTKGSAADLQVTARDIDELLDEINTMYPPAQLTRNNVVFSHVGKVAAYTPKTASRDQASPQIVKHSRIIDHEMQDGIQGLITVESVKYTTAPAIAVELRELLKKRRPLPSAGIFKSGSRGTDSRLSAEDQQWLARMHALFPHVTARYGTADAAEIFALCKSDEQADTLVLNDPPLLRAEILYAVQQEMAISLADVVIRRTAVGTCGCPNREKLVEIARVMAPLRGWDENRIANEVEDLLKLYQTDLGVCIQYP